MALATYTARCDRIQSRRGPHQRHVVHPVLQANHQRAGAQMVGELSGGFFGIHSLNGEEDEIRIPSGVELG